MSSAPEFTIGYDAKRLFTNWTGLGNYSRTLLTNLEDFYPDTEFVLYTPKVPDEPFVKPFLREPYRIIRPKGKLKGWWRRFGIAPRLKPDRIDLYHGLSNELPSGIRQSGVPSVVTIHDLIFKRHPETYSLADQQIYDYKFRAACRDADQIVAISESTKTDIIHYYGVKPEKVEVVYQSCDPIYYREPLEEVEARTVLESYGIPDEYILYVGSVIERKNLLNLVKALELMPKDLRIPLVVVGRGKKYKRWVEQYATTNGLSGWIQWQPQVLSTYDLKAIYEMASAFVYPSIYEGFGLPIVEAMLSHTPVVTSNTSSLPEASGPQSLLIDPGQPDEIAARLQEILSDEDFRQKVVEAGYDYASATFSPERTTQQMMGIYQRTIESEN